MTNRIINWCLDWKKMRAERLWTERKIKVNISDKMISASFPDGIDLSTSLCRLQKVEVFTNDSGPWGADDWYVFTSTDGFCKYPQGATGEQAALDYMLNLNGFDEPEFIKAMGCTSSAQFLCWERKNSSKASTKSVS